MSTEKLSELSKPVFEIEVSGAYWLNCTSGKLTPDAGADFSDWPDGVNRLYSQEYVSALLAELEAKDKRIAELEVGHQEAAKQIASWRRIAKQNIEEREKDLAALDAERQKITGLEAKLATPVRLPKRWDVSGQVNPPRIVEVQFEQQNRTHDQCAEAIRAAGFAVSEE